MLWKTKPKAMATIKWSKFLLLTMKKPMLKDIHAMDCARMANVMNAKNPARTADQKAAQMTASALNGVKMNVETVLSATG